MDYPSTKLHQQSGIHIEGKFKVCTTHITFPPICQQTSLTTADTTKQPTKHTSPYFSNDAACNLVIDVWKKLQKLERTLCKITQYTTKILAILEPSSTHCPCNKPGIPHLRHSTATNTRYRKTQNPNYPQPDTSYHPKLELPICTALHPTKAVPAPQSTDTTKLDPKHSTNRDNMASTTALLTNQPIPNQILWLYQCHLPQSQTLNKFVPCSNCPSPTSPASQNHYNPSQVHTQTMFAEWCKKHVSSTKMLQRLIKRCRMEDIHVLAQAQTNLTNLHPGTPHDAEFERHHFQEHMLHAICSTRTKHTIPDEEMLATYDAKISLPTTQLHIMSTICCQHVCFWQYYNMNHIQNMYHFNAHPLHQWDKIWTATHHTTLRTRNIWSVLQNKP